MAGVLRGKGKYVLVAFFILAIFAASRLINLTGLPIFTDEAIYIRWSQIGARDANWRFISLTDGKQPMFTWIAMVLLRVLPHWDPLLVGRLVSVFAGLGSIVGIGVLAYILSKNKRVALFACFLYVISPFTLLYDRMALYDSLVATFSIWNLILAILLVRTIRLDVALLSGLMLGMGMLNKTSGFLSLYLLPMTLILFDWKNSHWKKRLLYWVGYVVLAAGISQILYSVLRLSPLLHTIKEKDALFVYPISEWITHPFRFLEGNLRGMFDWAWRYLSVPLFVAICGAVILKHITRERILLFLWSVAPFFLLAMFGKVLYPRYILFMIMPLFILAALSADWIVIHVKNPFIVMVLFACLCIPSVYASTQLLLDPARAPIPGADTGQYINDWPAGGGVKEVTTYLTQKAKHEKIAIYTEGTFGLLPYAIELYLVDHPNVKLKGIWPIPSEPPQDVLEDVAHLPTFLVLNQSQVAPPGWPLELIHEYQKGINPDRHLRFFRVVPHLALHI